MDWEKFCNSQHIEYDKTSAMESRGYVNIHCPMCGDADTSRHLGLHKSGRWSCYRDPTRHRGKDPRTIIMRILGCGYDAADSYISEEAVDLSDFDEAAAEFFREDEEKEEQTLELPKEFRPLTSKRGRAKMYWNYLVRERGYPDVVIPSLVKRYNIHYCDQGLWRGRIIFPITLNGKLVSWTGRTVYDSVELRYKSLSHRRPDSDFIRPTGLISVRDLLFNFDNAIKRRYKVCVLVEGPLDVTNVDFFGRKVGVTAVSTFGTGIRKPQLELLSRLSERCEKLVTCGDQNAEGNVMDLISATYDMHLGNVPLPHNVGDPAELSKKQIIHLFRNP